MHCKGVTQSGGREAKELQSDVLLHKFLYSALWHLPGFLFSKDQILDRIPKPLLSSLFSSSLASALLCCLRFYSFSGTGSSAVSFFSSTIMIVEDALIHPHPLPFSYLCFFHQTWTACLLSLTGRGYQHALASSLWAVLSVGLVSAQLFSSFVIAIERQ